MCSLKIFPLLFCCFVSGWAQNTGYTASLLAGADPLNDGGSALRTFLAQPLGVAADAAGNIYVSDGLQNRIRKITAGIVTTYAGNGTPGYSGDEGLATEASLYSPAGIALDAAGNLYIADRGNAVIRMVSPSGIISTVAGNGSTGYNGENVDALDAQFAPHGVAVDPAGNLYIADLVNYRVRKVDVNGKVTTVAGNGSEGYSGDGGLATKAELESPYDVAVDATGNIFIADGFNGVVRMVDPLGKISSIAGTGYLSPVKGATPALSTPMIPIGVAVDSSGVLYITDIFNNEIFSVVPSTGNIATIAGNGTLAFSGDGGVAISASLATPIAPVVDKKGNLFFADAGNYRVREVSKFIIQTVAGAGNGDGGPAGQAFLNTPSDAAYDASGNLYIADTANGALRKVSVSNGNVTSIGSFGLSTDNGNPISVAVDSQGNVLTGTDSSYITQTNPTGQTTVIAGTGTSGGKGDGGQARNAQLYNPSGLAYDAAGNLYVADYYQEVVRKIDTKGIITTIAGSGNIVASGDGGPAIAAGVDPLDVAVDAAGNVYVADQLNNRIRKIGSDGKISTIAGVKGLPGYAGDGGPAAQASLDSPASVAVDAQGNVFIADEGNSVIRRINATTGIIDTVAGNGEFFPFSLGDGSARGVTMDPARIRLDGKGDLIVTDFVNGRILKLSAVTISPAQMAAVTGDGQTGSTGEALSVPLAVHITGSDGFNYAGATVTFTVTQGEASVSPASALTDGNGNASTTVTLGEKPGPVVVTASSPGLNTITFSLTAAAGPSVGAGGVVGAGLSSPVVSAVVTGGIISVFGSQLAPPGTKRNVSEGDIVNGNLPTSLAGTCVLVGGKFAPLFYVSDTQINAQIPATPPANSVPVQVAVNCGEPAEVRGAPMVVSAQNAAPEFFYSAHGSNGKNYVSAVNATRGGYVGPVGLIAGGSFAPAKVGDILTIYATGFGATTPAQQPGVLAPAAADVTQSVTVQLGGVTLNATDILYTGVAPTFAGLNQLNLRIPAGVSTGDQPLTITIGGIASPPNAVVTIGK